MWGGRRPQAVGKADCHQAECMASLLSCSFAEKKGARLLCAFEAAMLNREAGKAQTRAEPFNTVMADGDKGFLL